MDGKSGWYSAHKVGDLIRVVSLTTINFDAREDVGDLGVVVNCPSSDSGILFIEAYMFKTNRLRWFAPKEIDIISNIDEQLPIYLEGSRYEADQQFCRGDVTNMRLDKLWSLYFFFVHRHAPTTVTSTI